MFYSGEKYSENSKISIPSEINKLADDGVLIFQLQECGNETFCFLQTFPVFMQCKL